MDNLNVLLLILLSQCAVMHLAPSPRMNVPTLLMLAVYRVCVYIILMTSGELLRFGSLNRCPMLPGV